MKGAGGSGIPVYGGRGGAELTRWNRDDPHSINLTSLYTLDRRVFLTKLGRIDRIVPSYQHMHQCGKRMRERGDSSDLRPHGELSTLLVAPQIHEDCLSTLSTPPALPVVGWAADELGTRIGPDNPSPCPCAKAGFAQAGRPACYHF